MPIPPSTSMPTPPPPAKNPITKIFSKKSPPGGKFRLLTFPMYIGRLHVAALPPPAPAGRVGNMKTTAENQGRRERNTSLDPRHRQSPHPRRRQHSPAVSGPFAICYLRFSVPPRLPVQASFMTRTFHRSALPSPSSSPLQGLAASRNLQEGTPPSPISGQTGKQTVNFPPQSALPTLPSASL